MSLRGNEARLTGRRRFFAEVSTAAAGVLAAGRTARGGETPVPASLLLPTIALGTYRVTRLVAGSNPLCGYSYLGKHMDRHMKEYFTVERTVDFLGRCERAGINTLQFSSSPNVLAAIRIMRERGSGMQFICLHAGKDGVKGAIADQRPIAMVHHGGVTDRLFAAGKSGDVHDYVKAVHDRGVLAGVSAHNPDCIKRIADEGWEVDFFMTCFYFLTRKATAPGAAKAPKTLAINYHFYADDPHAMTGVIRQVRQPCLGFKILAAGRKCGSERSVHEAFRYAFQRIKPTDGVIVGMYPRFFDEISANARLTRDFATT